MLESLVAICLCTVIFCLSERILINTNNSSLPAVSKDNVDVAQTSSGSLLQLPGRRSKWIQSTAVPTSPGFMGFIPTFAFSGNSSSFRLSKSKSKPLNHYGPDHQTPHWVSARHLRARRCPPKPAASNQRALAACANTDYARELRDRTIARHLATVEQLRNEVAGRRRLAASTVLGKDHKSTSVTSTTADATTLFGTTPKCFLEPEVTQGPYYVSGELVRTDIKETQKGIDLTAELQIIDVNTCTPVKDYYVDFWHCNATGMYSGVVASGNGNSADLPNVNATFLRGLAATNADGIVTFKTIFPGHYTSRTTHIHVLGFHDGTLQSNNTYTGGKVASVGQLFFGQSLITSVEATDVYKVNTQAITQNSADTIFGEEVVGDFDPVMNYALLGNSVTDGISAWISIGVNRTVSKTVAAAATLTTNGGVASSTTNTGGGAGGPPAGAPNGAPNPTTPTTTSTATPTTTPTPTPSTTTSSTPAAVAGSVLASLVICLSALLLQ